MENTTSELERHHEVVWAAIEQIAKSHGFSVSGLAKHAGLDVTTFNKSKRFGVKGLPRYPKMDTILKVLASLNLNWFQWASIYGEVAAKLKVEIKNA